MGGWSSALSLWLWPKGKTASASLPEKNNRALFCTSETAGLERKQESQPRFPGLATENWQLDFNWPLTTGH
jgi:hypothetical protein